MAASETKLQLNADNLDIGDYMDIVTTYKCRFCEFTSTYPQGISKHVREVHVAAPVVVMPIHQLPSTFQGQSSNEALDVAAAVLEEEVKSCQGSDGFMKLSETESNEPTSGVLEDSKTFNSMETILKNVASEKIVSEKMMQSSSVQSGSKIVTSFVDGSPCVMVSSGIQVSGITMETVDVNTENDGPCVLSTLSDEGNSGASLGNNNTNPNAEGGVQTLQNILQMMSKQEMDTSDGVQQTEDEAVKQKTFPTSIVNTSSGATTLVSNNPVTDIGSSESSDQCQTLEVLLPVNSGDASSLQMTVDNTDNSSSVFESTQLLTETDNRSSEVTTRELFVCGQCNCGFNTFEDCQAHMMQEHKVEVQEEMLQEPNKVNVATQVEGKKRPGRKRKSEVKPSVTPNAEDTDFEIRDSDLDSDWEVEEYTPRPSRSRRKIRPPKALQEDYFMGKRKRQQSSSPISEIVERQSSPKYTLKCPEAGCHAKFLTEDALGVHQKCHVPNSLHFLCHVCQEVHNVWKSLRFHLWKTHQIDTDLLTCDKCQPFRTDTMSKLLVHMEVHGEDKPYMCSICGKGFKQFAQMHNHQVIHESRHKHSNKWYSAKQCDICGRTFANRKCLMTHMEGVHGKEKPFKCPYCPYATSRKAMIELHVRTHTGDKPFKCDQCSYTSGDHNSLRRHKMRHTGQKPYKCQFCNYDCIQSISFKMHMKNKHPGISAGVFCCDMCTFRTVREESYRNHLMDHQNGLIPDPQPTTTPMLKQLVIHGSSMQQQQLPQQELQLVTQDGTLRVEQLVQSHLQADGQSGGEEVIEIQPLKSIPDSGYEVTPNGQLQLQIQTLDTGETQISSDDLSRLNEYEGSVNPDITAAQLVITALNAISQKGSDEDNTPQIINGVQTSITSSTIKDGVTNHTITFHLPTPPVSENSFYVMQGTELCKLSTLPVTTTEPQQIEDGTLVFSVPMETVLVKEPDIELEQTEGVIAEDTLQVNSAQSVSD